MTTDPDRPLTTYSVWLKYADGSWDEEWSGYESLLDATGGLKLAFQQAEWAKSDVIGGCVLMDGQKP